MDIDYGAVFGLGETGEELTEAAEPPAGEEAQGVNEQEAAAPAGDGTQSEETEGLEDSREAAGEAAADTAEPGKKTADAGGKTRSMPPRGGKQRQSATSQLPGQSRRRRKKHNASLKKRFEEAGF